MWCINKYGIMDIQEQCDDDSIDLLREQSSRENN